MEKKEPYTPDYPCDDACQLRKNDPDKYYQIMDLFEDKDNRPNIVQVVKEFKVSFSCAQKIRWITDLEDGCMWI